MRAVVGLEKNAGLEAPATAERVAAAQEPNANLRHLSNALDSGGVTAAVRESC